jgi:hypothetical protein
MYRINPLKRNVLITVDEVVFHAPTKQTLDPRTIEQHIIVAEERFIRPHLGYDFYQALVVAKNTIVTSANKGTLETQINNSLEEGQTVAELTEGQVVNAYEFLSTDNQKLWTEHLWKLTAECVMLLAYPEGLVQFGTEGVHLSNPPASPMGGGTASPDLRTMKWAMDKKLMDRIDPLLESMHQWLCKQQDADVSKFATYDKDCDCNYEGVAYKRKTDFILGLYDDVDNDECEKC